MENDEDIAFDLKKYKGHFRKFPWALVIRILVIVVSLAVIFFLMKTVTEFQDKREKLQKDTEIEIELQVN